MLVCSDRMDKCMYYYVAAKQDPNMFKQMPELDP